MTGATSGAGHVYPTGHLMSFPFFLLEFILLVLIFFVGRLVSFSSVFICNIFSEWLFDLLYCVCRSPLFLFHVQAMFWDFDITYLNYPTADAAVFFANI